MEQLQKLALSRAIFRNSPVMILDEPSSALDPNAEYMFFDNLKKLYMDKTIIYISHRLSCIDFAQRIIVIEGGKVTGDGTKNDLIKTNKRFNEFVRAFNLK